MRMHIKSACPHSSVSFRPFAVQSMCFLFFTTFRSPFFVTSLPQHNKHFANLSLIAAITFAFTSPAVQNTQLTAPAKPPSQTSLDLEDVSFGGRAALSWGASSDPLRCSNIVAMCCQHVLQPTGPRKRPCYYLGDCIFRTRLSFVSYRPT